MNGFKIFVSYLKKNGQGGHYVLYSFPQSLESEVSALTIFLVIVVLVNPVSLCSFFSLSLSFSYDTSDTG